MNTEANSNSNLNRVLVVEDDPGIGMVARIALEDVGGLIVLVCTSGGEALSRIADFSPDLVLLDVMMPGMTGPQTLKALRTREDARGVPVVFMTARVQQREIDEYLALGAIGVIPKPFEPMTLANELRTLLSRGAAPTVSAEEAEELSFQEELRLLRDQYLSTLPGQVASLRERWESGDAESVRRLAHTIVGTGSTLGLKVIADAAADIERVTRAPHADWIGRVPLLVALERAVADTR